MRIKFFLMRHSKSCSNLVRATDEDASQSIRDPGLTQMGAQAARAYGPRLRQKLAAEGFDVGNAVITSSKLQRAKETATLVFSRAPIALPFTTEFGVFLENTPAASPYQAPQWQPFLAALCKHVKDGDSVALVAHGSYLRSLWPRLTGRPRKERLKNMDGILVEATLSPTQLRVHSAKEILYSGPSMDSKSDQCKTGDKQKIARYRRDTMKQRGGSSQSIGYFNNGLQMRGTEGSPTGTGLAGMTDDYARAPLPQSGGRTRKRQGGGFSASVMGAFASNGLRLLPLAGYMGYRMYSNDASTRKRSRRSGQRSKRSRQSKGSKRSRRSSSRT